MKKLIPVHTLDMLSAYLDGQVSSVQKKRLERELSDNVPLRQALDDLRQTRTVLRAVPRRKIPRSFLLTPEMVKEKSRSKVRSGWVPAFSLSSISATVLLVITLITGLLPRLSQTAMSPAAPVPATQEARLAVEMGGTPTIPIILWGEPGGGGVAGKGFGGGGAAEPIVIIPVETSQPTRTAAAGLLGAASTSIPPAQPSEGVPTLSADLVAPVSPGNGPILGIRPTNESILRSTPEPPQSPVGNGLSPKVILQISLLGIAVTTGLAAFLLRRKFQV